MIQKLWPHKEFNRCNAIISSHASAKKEGSAYMMSVRYSFVTVCESLGSIGWRIDVTGLTTPTFRLAAGEATIAWPIAAAGGLIAAQQWSNEAWVLNNFCLNSIKSCIWSRKKREMRHTIPVWMIVAASGTIFATNLQKSKKFRNVRSFLFSLFLSLFFLSFWDNKILY